MTETLPNKHGLLMSLNLPSDVGHSGNFKGEGGGGGEGPWPQRRTDPNLTLLRRQIQRFFIFSRRKTGVK